MFFSMRIEKAFFIKAAILLSIMLFFFTAPDVALAGDEDNLKLIREYVKQVPPLTAYGKDTKAMVWQRSHEYKLLADGSMLVRTKWLIYSESPLSESWSNWKFPFVGDERVTIDEAKIYDPVSFELYATLSPKKTESGGLSWYEVNVPPLDIPNVLVISYQKEYPGRWNVDDAIPIGLDLPQWRIEIAVSLPHGSSLTWITPKDRQVSHRLVQGVEDTYTWEFINQFPEGINALEEGNDNFLVFSMRSGWLNAIKPLEDWASGLKSIVPEAVGKFIGNNKQTAGTEIFKWAGREDLLLQDFKLSDVRRSPEAIPKEGPWTSWERTVLTAHWLSMAGWDVRINWLPFVVPDDDVPGTPKMISRPILEARTPGSSTYKIYDLGSSATGSVTIPDSLWGETLCFYDGSSVQLKQIDRGRVGDHRLRVKWNLELTESGEAKGTLELNLNGGWPYVVFGGQNPFSDLSSSMRIYPPQIVVRWDEGEISERQGGVRIVYPVSGILGIPSDSQMLLRFPMTAFNFLEDLGSMDVGSRLRFPFLVEGIVTLKLPQGFEAFSTPSLQSKKDGKIQWEQKIDERSRGRIVEANWRLLVNETSINEETFLALRAGFKALQQWNNLAIPIRKK
jgi:hypothetical protein